MPPNSLVSADDDVCLAAQPERHEGGVEVAVAVQRRQTARFAEVVERSADIGQVGERLQPGPADRDAVAELTE